MNTVLTDSTDLQGLFEHVKFITGQTNLKFKDFVRMVNFALDDYSSIALSADGRWKFEDHTQIDSPHGSTTVTAGQRAYTIDTGWFGITRVEIILGGTRHVVEPIDQREYKDVSLEREYFGSGITKFYDYDGQQIKLYPAPNAAGTLHVDYSRPTPYFSVDDTAATIGIPRVHHRFIALKVIKEVMIAKNDPSVTKIEQELVAWEGMETQGRLSGGKIREYFTTRDENTPRRIRNKRDLAFSRRFGRSGTYNNLNRSNY